MWSRRLLLLLSLYFVVDFADPYVISPVTAQVEDGEEEAVTTHAVRVKTPKSAAPRRSDGIRPPRPDIRLRTASRRPPTPPRDRIAARRIYDTSRPDSPADDH
jgi:hypothetical protein